MVDLKTIISEVTKACRLGMDVADHKPETLIYLKTLTDLWETELTLRILAWKLTSFSANRILDRTKIVANQPATGKFKTIYDLHPEREPIEFLISMNCWRDRILAEINRRTNSNPIGKEIVAFRANNQMGKLTDAWILPLLRALEVDYKEVRPWRTSTQQLETEDLELMAVNIAIREHEILRKSLTVKAISIPMLPSSFLGIPDEPDGLRTRLYLATQETIVESLQFFLPMLESRLEDCNETVRQSHRELFRKLDRQKRISSDYEWQIGEQIHTQPQTDTDSKIDCARAYRIAQRRWGARGVKFLEALAQMEDVSKASTAAGVSRQMGHKYLKELQKSLAQKKSPD